MADDLTIESDNQNKDIITRKELTDKNILFLHYLKTGKGTIEAYELAGYKGNAHAAYELRSSLKNEIANMLNGEGFGTREGLLLKLKKLQDLPLISTNLTVKEALELLKLESKFQPKESKEHKQTITPIIINISGGNISGSSVVATNEAEASKVAPIDITPIEVTETL